MRVANWESTKQTPDYKLSNSLGYENEFEQNQRQQQEQKETVCRRHVLTKEYEIQEQMIIPISFHNLGMGCEVLNLWEKKENFSWFLQFRI